MNLRPFANRMQFGDVVVTDPAERREIGDLGANRAIDLMDLERFLGFAADALLIITGECLGFEALERVRVVIRLGGIRAVRFVGADPLLVERLTAVFALDGVVLTHPKSPRVR